MRCQSAFTLIELLVSIGVMLLLATLAIPIFAKVLHRNAVQASASDLVDLWRQARLLALTRNPPNSDSEDFGKSYGISIAQAANQSTQAALIKGKVQDNQLLDLSLGEHGTYSVLRSITFKPQVIVCALTGSPPVEPNPLAMTWYAQYGTGLPIRASAVTAGTDSLATPCSVGVRDPQGRLASLKLQDWSTLRVQSLDFLWGKTGAAFEVCIFHAGLATSQEYTP